MSAEDELELHSMDWEPSVGIKDGPTIDDLLDEEAEKEPHDRLHELRVQSDNKAMSRSLARYYRDCEKDKLYQMKLMQRRLQQKNLKGMIKEK